MTDHLYFAWFLLAGRPWVEHECVAGEVLVWCPPNPPWRLTEAGGISPSFVCTRCGRHTVLGPTDRCETPEGIEYARCLDAGHLAVDTKRDALVLPPPPFIQTQPSGRKEADDERR